MEYFWKVCCIESATCKFELGEMVSEISGTHICNMSCYGQEQDSKYVSDTSNVLSFMTSHTDSEYYFLTLSLVC